MGKKIFISGPSMSGKTTIIENIKSDISKLSSVIRSLPEKEALVWDIPNEDTNQQILIALAVLQVNNQKEFITDRSILDIVVINALMSEYTEDILLYYANSINFNEFLKDSKIFITTTLPWKVFKNIDEVKNFETIRFDRMNLAINQSRKSNLKYSDTSNAKLLYNYYLKYDHALKFLLEVCDIDHLVLPHSSEERVKIVEGYINGK